jgi:uncharacterized DUF497 family protein
MPASFEWDHPKAVLNEAVHRVRFEDAAGAFDDPFALTIEDELHSEHEERYILIGVTTDLRLLTVVYAMRDAVTRIISARRATAREREQYVRQLG